MIADDALRMMQKWSVIMEEPAPGGPELTGGTGGDTVRNWHSLT
jgi:hypothetical protein